MVLKQHPPEKTRNVEKMTRQEARREAEALKQALEYHNHLYYAENRQEISDAAYDRMFRRLEDLEGRFPGLQSKDSPTLRVGAKPVSRLRKREHTVVMLSLRAVREQNEVERFVQDAREKWEGRGNPAFSLEPKFDGFSIEVIYEKGWFAGAVTRGDGETGEDVSHNVRRIRAFPLRLLDSRTVPKILAVRGEVFLPKSEFQRLNRERLGRGDEAFANPRNAAAGIMRQLDPEQVPGQWMQIVFYEILKLEGGRVPASHVRGLKQVADWGLPVSADNQQGTDAEKIKKYWARMEERRDSLDYEIDGVVVKTDDYGLRRRLGRRERNPRWALALKFPPREEQTRLVDIVVQVGKSGMLTPVGLLDPVDVGGVTVSRATLHNEAEVRRKAVLPGDQVRVQRAGDVIPEITGPVEKVGQKRGKLYTLPGRCPACGSKTRREGAYVFCDNGLACPAQLKGRIMHFASRRAMNIEGLGEKTVEQMIGQGMIKDISDLFYLSTADLKKIKGFAEDSAIKLYGAVQKAKQARLDKLIYALGIHLVGEHAARMLANHYGSLEVLMNVDEKDIMEISGMGGQVANSTASFFHNPENIKALRHLQQAGFIIKSIPAPEKKVALKGKTVVFTGELSGYTRAEAKDQLEILGGHASDSVTSKTDLVVAGKKPGGKLKQARNKKVQIVDEREFEDLLRSVQNNNEVGGGA